MASKRTRYPAKVAAVARRMAEADKGVSEIRAFLKKNGYEPSHSTVLCWIDPDYRVAQGDRARACMRRRRGTSPGARPGPKRPNPERLRLARIKQLRAAKVSVASIARVMNLDFPTLDLSEKQVHRLLNGVKPETLARYLYPERAES